VLGDKQSHRRQIEHLACFLPGRLAVREVTPAAATAIWHVHNDLIGPLDPLEMMAIMAGLATRFAARTTTKTPRHRRLG
jgi:hypothetical protein